MPDVRGVLLDLDDTLLDHRGAADRAAVEWAQSVATESSVDPVERWRVLEARFFPQFERGQCSFQEQRRRRVRGFSDALARLPDADADALFDRYLALYRQHWLACPGAAELIERAVADGCRVGVLTNGDEAQQRDKLAAIGLVRTELHVFASTALGSAKPAPLAFELACSGLGTLGSQTVMVGDDYDKDVQAARAAGLRAIHVSRDPSESHGETLSSLKEAADLLFGRS